MLEPTLPLSWTFKIGRGLEQLFSSDNVDIDRKLSLLEGMLFKYIAFVEK